ncbi:MAG TPA: GEVED domain-containing protein, partial [Chitinophagaceae bacterium]|nr:GEVED domain-containing protein [Chitinophagaceae bacterium]
FFALLGLNSQAQVSVYTFTAVAGSYSAITGISPTLTGDGVPNPIPDEGIANAIPIGFPFVFSGAPYTTVGVSTNGFISFGAALTTWGFVNNLSTGPAGSTTARPLAAPLWDDHDIQVSTNLQYTTLGSFPNRIFVMQWSNVKWQFGATAGGIAFQVRLYETTNVVEFVYNQLAGATSTPSASIGLAAGGTGSGNFLSLNNATASPTASSTFETTTISTKPATGQVYRFTPPSCSAPGGLSATGIGPTSATLNWVAVSGASGYEYAVTTSATPPASGTATVLTSVPSGVLTIATIYYLHVRTNCGGPFSSWASISFTTSIDCSAAEAISGCGVSKSASLSGSGAGVYNITDCGFNTPGNEKLYTFTPPSTGLYTLNITAANGNYIDYFYKPVSGGCTPSGWTCIDDNNAIGTDVFGPLTGGTPYYILLDAEDNTVTSTVTFDLICPVALPPPCTTLTGPANGATNVAQPPVLTWDAAPGATAYNVYFSTVNPPTTLLGSTGATTATINGTVGSTTYYWYVAPTNTAGEATGCAAGTFSFTTAAAPVNDEVCNAIPLTLGGPQDCKNTANASATGDPSLSCSTPNNTVWYTYTPASTGTAMIRMEIPGAATDALDGWVAFYTATGTCPALSLTQFGDCTEFGQTGVGDIDSITSPVLTGGTTYYIMIDGFSSDVGEFCISVVVPPAPPLCTTNIAPANGATGVVSVPGGIPLSWNAAATATSYDVYFGPTATPPLIGNIAATTVNITGTNYNATYYWYVAPRNVGGAATGCISNMTSFTTENPVNCIPSYGTGCSSADSLTYFSLKGAAGTVIYNPSGTTCSTTPLAYSDYTGAFSAVTLVRGESFGGFMRTGDPNDYATIWIDGNDNGYFEDNERIMNNLLIGTTTKLYTLYIPTTTPLGTHRLRVRIIYSSSRPATPTHPCNPYTYGETEDYLVNITNVGSPHNVATGLPGSCMTAGQVTIDAASNNNNLAPVFLVDSLNNYVTAIYPNGNNFGTINPTYYVHNGSVRQTSTGRYYLDRNASISVDTQATLPFNLRYFFRTAELNALIAQPGSGVTSIFDLTMTKTAPGTCTPVYDGLYPQGATPSGFGSLTGDRFLDFTGLTSFSTLYLHGGLVLLNVDLLSFAGQREGTMNKLRWTTATEQNNRGFDIQRSEDGTNWASIGFMNSLAPNGTSNSQLTYSFTDNTVAGRKLYYRLRQVNLDGASKFSSTVLIKGDKAALLTIDGLRPNPASTEINVIIATPSRDKVTIRVIDITGKTVVLKLAEIEAGTNTIPLDISRINNGTYIVKLECSGNCENAVSKFVKQ